MPKSKFSALLSLLLVFSSGVLVGAVANRLYMVNTVNSHGLPPARPTGRPSPDEVRKQIIADMRDHIKVDDGQIAKINQIMDDTAISFRQIRDKLNSEGKVIHDKQWDDIRGLMRPEQMAQFDQWHAQREAEMQAQREADRKRHQGPPPK